MINQVVIQGNLVRDPEEKNGCVWFTVAVNHVYKNKEGEKVEEPSFIRVITGGGTGKAVMGNLGKGAGVVVTGRLKTQQDADKKTSTSVVAHQVTFLNKPKPAEAAPQDPAPVEAPKWED